MTISVGILLFPEVEVLDFCGPYEVFTTASRVFRRDSPSLPEPFSVFTVASDPGAIRARAGLEVRPDHGFAHHPEIDLLVIPGGVVTAELEKPAVIAWIARMSRQAEITASVCTGAFLLAKAGLLDGRPATTHWEDLADLRAMFPPVSVVDRRRWVDDGSVATSAGISAGIDLCLHLVERLAGRELALRTARQMDYGWQDGAQEGG